MSLFLGWTPAQAAAMTSAGFALSDSGTTNGGTTSLSTSFQLRGAVRNETGVTGKSTLYAVSGGIIPGIQTYNVIFASGTNGSVIGTTSQNITYGGSTTAVTAVPAGGFHFVDWTEGATVAGTTAALTISNVTAAHSYTANFAIDLVNGICGSSDKTIVATSPTTNLCTTGTASAVTGGSSSFNWTCSGDNGGSPASCSAAIDITAPLLTVSTLANNTTTTNATLNVAGTVSDSGSGVKSLTVNGTAATISKDGTFSAAITLVDGINTLTTVATDNVNNPATDTRMITLDRTAPGLTIAQPADNGITGKNFVEITGNVDDANSAVSARINNGAATKATMSGTSFSATLNLASGLNTIYITATDLAGNSSSAKRSITSDTTAPTLAVTSPAQDVNTTQSSLTLSGTVKDAITSATVTVAADDQTYALVVAADGNFSQTINLPADKTYAVVVTATDQAGNVATAQRNIIKGTSALIGDMTGDGKINILDAYMILEIAVGRVQPTASDLRTGDVAPIMNGIPSPDGVIDVADVVVILRKIVGLVNW